ncbi:MAG: M15 family metallopeptidase [Alloprevotella sp.]|nr:M15 family metallopeptidase [Alloprevotella sp.]
MQRKRALKCLWLVLMAIWSLSIQAQKSPTELSMERQGLVDIQKVDSSIRVSLMYGRADNFTGQVLYTDLHTAYLHPEAAQALRKAQSLLQRLRPDLSLIVFDAARPMSVQQKMYNVVAGTPKNIYVSNPRNGGGLHNYGLAVDISICQKATGDTLQMGTLVDHMSPLSHTDKEATLRQQGKLSSKAIENRQLLRRVMREAGFRQLPSEWWHYNLRSRAEARQRYRLIK